MKYKAIITTHRKILGITIRKKIGITAAQRSRHLALYSALKYIWENNLCDSIISVLEARNVGTTQEEYKKAFG